MNGDGNLQNATQDTETSFCIQNSFLFLFILFCTSKMVTILFPEPKTVRHPLSQVSYWLFWSLLGVQRQATTGQQVSNQIKNFNYGSSNKKLTCFATHYLLIQYASQYLHPYQHGGWGIFKRGSKMGVGKISKVIQRLPRDMGLKFGYRGWLW